MGRLALRRALSCGQKLRTTDKTARQAGKAHFESVILRARFKNQEIENYNILPDSVFPPVMIAGRSYSSFEIPVLCPPLKPVKNC